MPTTTLPDVEAVLDTMATPVVVWDLEGRMLASNAAAATLFGYTLAQMRTINRAQIVHPEDLQAVQERINRRRAGDRTRRQFAQRVVTASGAVRQCACSAAAYEYDGQVIGTVVVYFDGERLELVGGAFARNAALFRELFESSPVAVFSTGPDGRFDTVNPTARLLLQRPIEELEALSSSTSSRRTSGGCCTKTRPSEVLQRTSNWRSSARTSPGAGCTSRCVPSRTRRVGSLGRSDSHRTSRSRSWSGRPRRPPRGTMR